MSVEIDITRYARELGFAAVGILPAAPSQTTDVLQRWLDSGFDAGMTYMRRHVDLRADPRRLVPEARSLVVAAARYPANPRPGYGISTYARGRDYHDVLRQKLHALGTMVREAAGARIGRVCVDSAPLLEREWALRAGIGVRGRQGQVVAPHLGSCLLLGELLVDVPLPTHRSPPLPPGGTNVHPCRNCRLCVDACPTGALRDNGLVDAGKCISYLTIEHEGEIPPDLRGKLGEALFGCDLCTAVCPLNHAGEHLVMPELADLGVPTADACAAMSDEDFSRRFRGSAVSRGGAARLRRNASIAIKNRAAGRK